MNWPYRQPDKRGPKKGEDPNGTYLSPVSATTTVCGLDAAQSNLGCGVMAEQFPPHFAVLHAGYV